MSTCKLIHIQPNCKSINYLSHWNRYPYSQLTLGESIDYNYWKKNSLKTLVTNYIDHYLR